MKAKEITQERIESKVERITETGCWVWMGTTTARGYGQIESNKRKHYAHRASYEAFIGPIPKGMHVCHACDNVYCVNPGHLFLGTQKQNLEDMARKGRSTRGEKNPRAKLNEELVKIIKTSFECGMPIPLMASICRVSESAIEMIVKGKRWKHVQ